MRIKIELKQKNKTVERRKKTCLSEEGESVTHLRETTAGFLHHTFTISQSRRHTQSPPSPTFMFIVISASTLAEQQIVRWVFAVCCNEARCVNIRKTNRRITQDVSSRNSNNSEILPQRQWQRSNGRASKRNSACKYIVDCRK